MNFESFVKKIKSGITIVTFFGVFIGGVFAVGEWYGNRKSMLDNLQKKDVEIEAKLDRNNVERKEECAAIKQDISDRLERIEKSIGKVVEYVWQGEGDKCKILSQHRKKTKEGDKKKSVKSKKRNDTQQYRVYAVD